MIKMLHHVKNIEHYVDDNLVHTAVWTEHVEILRELFNRMREAGLTIRPTKFCLGYLSQNLSVTRWGATE